MTTIFRVDSSDQIGSGHIFRCLNLAQKIKKTEDIVFFCKNLKGNFNKLVRKNYKIEIIPSIKKEKNYNHFSVLSKKTQMNEVSFLKEKLNKKKISKVIVDHYGLNYIWEREISKLSKNIIVVDDLANKKHFCKKYINYNYEGNLKKIRKLLIKKSSLFLGKKYTILGKRISLKRRSNNKKNILLYLGSVDKNNLSLKIIKILMKNEFKNFKISILIGKNNLNSTKIKKFVKKLNNIKCFKKQVFNNDVFLKNFDNIICAGGVFMHEVISGGFKPFVIAQNKFQYQIIQNLQKKNFINYIDHKSIDISKLSSSFLNNSNFYESKERMKKIKRFTYKKLTKNIIKIIN